MFPIKPQKPRRPTKPVEPQKEKHIQEDVVLLDLTKNIKIKDLIERLNQFDEDEVVEIDYDHEDYYGAGCSINYILVKVKRNKVVANDRYEKELKKYNSATLKHKKDLDRYNILMVKYKEELKLYNKYMSEIKTLAEKFKASK